MTGESARVVATLNVTKHGHAFTNPNVAGHSLPAGDYDLVTLTDHEAAMAAETERAEDWCKLANQRMFDNEKLTRRLTTLLTGLEALAGEAVKIRIALDNIDPDGSSVGYRQIGDASGSLDDLAARIRTLASAGLEGKQTTETNQKENLK